jgi:hypothetical protein
MFALFQRKKRSVYVREVAMPTRRLGKHPNAKVYKYRRGIFVVAIVLTLAFIAKVVLSFFAAEYISFELSGNAHYTEAQIYDILAEQLDNIVTDSEERTETYLKENLSYIKDAHVSKHVMKRLLTIEITEREPFALLKFYKGFKNSPVPGTTANRECSFFLVDVDTHILESIDVGEASVPINERFRGMVVLVAAGDTLPKVGTPVQTSGVPLGAEVLKIALLQQSELAAQIKSIDASSAQQIKIQTEMLPLPVWIAGDAIESGLHHIKLLLKQHSVRILALLEAHPSATQPYLDARFEDSLYFGGYAETD